jgi:hypothetical protein
MRKELVFLDNQFSLDPKEWITERIQGIDLCLDLKK